MRKKKIVLFVFIPDVKWTLPHSTTRRIGHRKKMWLKALLVLILPGPFFYWLTVFFIMNSYLHKYLPMLLPTGKIWWCWYKGTGRPSNGYGSADTLSNYPSVHSKLIRTLFLYTISWSELFLRTACMYYGFTHFMDLNIFIYYSAF